MEADLKAYVCFSTKKIENRFSPLASMHANACVIIQYDIPNTEGYCTGRKSQDSSVGIATGYRLDDTGVGVLVPERSTIFPSPYRPDRLWGPPNLLSNGYRGFFPGGKAAGREADHSPPTSAEVKKMWIYTSIPPYAFMA
jgi:hypothetical protein